VRRGGARQTGPVPTVTLPAALRPVGLYETELSEGLPVPREPAYADKRRQDAEAPAASE